MIRAGSRPRRKIILRGLTLAEVLVALSLVAVSALALLAIFISGTRMMKQSTDITMATDVGREFLETVKFDGFGAMTPGHYDGRVPTASDPVTLFPREPYPSVRRGNQDYYLVVDVTDETLMTRLVKVRVYWGNLHHIELATMVFK